MRIKMYIDANGNPIDINTVYRDMKNNVNDIYILEVDGKYFAKPDGLDEEPLENVFGGFTPLLAESEKDILNHSNFERIK